LKVTIKDHLDGRGKAYDTVEQKLHRLGEQELHEKLIITVVDTNFVATNTDKEDVMTTEDIKDAMNIEDEKDAANNKDCKY
jgi:hypothetical protein